MEATGCSAHLSPSSVHALGITVSDFCPLFTKTLTLFFHVGYIQDTVFCVDCIGITVKHWLSSRCDCYLLTTDYFD